MIFQLEENLVLERGCVDHLGKMREQQDRGTQAGGQGLCGRKLAFLIRKKLRCCHSYVSHEMRTVDHEAFCNLFKE